MSIIINVNGDIMSKITGLFLVFLFTVLSAFSADMRFVQVDSALYDDSVSENFEE